VGNDNRRTGEVRHLGHFGGSIAAHTTLIPRRGGSSIPAARMVQNDSGTGRNKLQAGHRRPHTNSRQTIHLRRRNPRDRRYLDPIAWLDGLERKSGNVGSLSSHSRSCCGCSRVPRRGVRTYGDPRPPIPREFTPAAVRPHTSADLRPRPEPLRRSSLTPRKSRFPRKCFRQEVMKKPSRRERAPNRRKSVNECSPTGPHEATASQADSNTGRNSFSGSSATGSKPCMR
jgi:hypothetical protein